MKRLDLFLSDSGLSSSREKAKRLIADGNIKVNGNVIKKPSFLVDGSEDIELLASDRYVGRGAYKLLGAFKSFDISVNGIVCADIGASTGGFTQVMLEKGAEKVYAIDVGHGQLAEQLINDSRVINCEGINVRSLPADFFDEPVRFAACDLSFISLTLIIPALCNALSDDAAIVTLIKPQFEAGRKSLDKHGIVKEKKDHIAVLESMTAFFDSNRLSVRGMTYSPISGGDGNIEYLAFLQKNCAEHPVFSAEKIVSEAFEKLR